VIAVEGRGNGRAGRPTTAEDYSDREYVDDAIAVLDAAGVDRAVVVGLSLGGRHALQLAAWYPERAAGVIAIGAALPWPVPPDFDEPKDSYQGWGKANRHYWLADYRGWAAAGRSRPGPPAASRAPETPVLRASGPIIAAMKER
jgi:pimeloyl-ACP methyl ester carboxylesterase